MAIRKGQEKAHKANVKKHEERRHERIIKLGKLEGKEKLDLEIHELKSRIQTTQYDIEHSVRDSNIFLDKLDDYKKRLKEKQKEWQEKYGDKE